MRNDNYITIESSRIDLGLSKGEMAKALGVSARQYSNWAINDAPTARADIAKNLVVKEKEITNLTLLQASYESKREALLTSFVLDRQNMHVIAERHDSNYGDEYKRVWIEQIEFQKQRFSYSYIYAYYKRMSPVFSIKDNAVDPFEAVYTIHGEFIKSIDNICKTNQFVSNYSFNDLESDAGGHGNRNDIMIVLEYLKILKYYDQEFFENMFTRGTLIPSGYKDLLQDDIFPEEIKIDF